MHELVDISGAKDTKMGISYKDLLERINHRPPFDKGLTVPEHFINHIRAQKSLEGTVEPMEKILLKNREDLLLSVLEDYRTTRK